MASRLVIALLSLVLLCSCSPRRAEPPKADKPESASARAGWWQLIRQDGTMLPGIYERIHAFRNGRARVRCHGKWGMIDTSGNFVIPAEYAWVEPFQHGVARVWKRESGDSACRAAYVDTAGKCVSAPAIWFSEEKYDETSPLLPLANSQPPESLEVWAARRVAFIEHNPDGDYSPHPPHEVDPRERYGYVDSTGHYVIPPIYTAASKFSEGLAWVTVAPFTMVTHVRQKACIDLNGHTVIPAANRGNGGLFRSGRAFIYVGETAGYVDRSGTFVIPADFNWAGDFADGLAVVGRRTALGHMLYGVIDTTGREVVPCIYEHLEAYSGNRAIFEFNGQYGYLDTHGNVAIPAHFESARAFQDGMAVCRARYKDGSGGMGIIDTTGGWLAPPIYRQAVSVGGGLIKVSFQSSARAY